MKIHTFNNYKQKKTFHRWITEMENKYMLPNQLYDYNYCTGRLTLETNVIYKNIFV